MCSHGTSLVVQWLRICLPMQHELDPWPRKVPHALEQLSPCTTTARSPHSGAYLGATIG